jgi:PTS system nitrogen regulatory IIA component
MNLETLLNPAAVVIESEIKSKKRALEVLAEILAENAIIINQREESDEQPADNITALAIFQSLIEREKLGSTCMGHGVALPHIHTTLTQHAVGAFLKLTEGVDFDGPDNLKTDLIFALMVPEHYTDEHLKILSYLATLFCDEAFCKALRDSNSNQEIYRHMTSWQITSQAS